MACARIVLQGLLLLLGWVGLVQARSVTLSNSQPRRTSGGDIVNAHSGNIVFVNGTYFLYGENYGTGPYVVPDNALLPKLVVYTSPDMVNWTFGGFLHNNTQPGWAASGQWPDAPSGTWWSPCAVWSEARRKMILWFSASPGTCCQAYFGVAQSDDGIHFELATLTGQPGRQASVDGSALLIDDDGQGCVRLLVCRLVLLIDVLCRRALAALSLLVCPCRGFCSSVPPTVLGAGVIGLWLVQVRRFYGHGCRRPKGPRGRHRTTRARLPELDGRASGRLFSRLLRGGRFDVQEEGRVFRLVRVVLLRLPGRVCQQPSSSWCWGCLEGASSACSCHCRSGVVVHTATSIAGPWRPQVRDVNCRADAPVCAGMQPEAPLDRPRSLTIPAQGLGISLIPSPTGGDPTVLWTGQRWLSAPFNNPSCESLCAPASGTCTANPLYIKGHDFDYWVPLDFSADGHILPFAPFVDQFNLEIL